MCMMRIPVLYECETVFSRVKKMLPHECNLFFSLILSRQGKGYTEVVLPNTKTLNIQLTIRKYSNKLKKL